MKESIRYKMIGMLVLIVSSVLLATWLLNVTFAEKYYIASEKESIIDSYENVKKCLLDDSNTEEESNLTENLEQISNMTNVKMLIAKSGDDFFDQKVIFSTMINGTRNYEQILTYLSQIKKQMLAAFDEGDLHDEEYLDQWLEQNVDPDLATLVTKGYYITRIRDKFSGQNGLYLFGFTDNDYLIAMRVSIEGIHTSVQISSRFMAYMGIIAILFGVCLISFYAYSFTRPIKEMAEVANRMTELDFEAKVKTRSKDEIGVLGSSINKLSSTLESTIADLKCANLELQQDIQKKEEIDEMRKEFLSHVSHELKTPIAIIQGYAEGLKDGIAEDQESMDFYCDVIMDEAQKMNQMVRKLLTLTQLEFGDTHVNIVRFDLQQMIENKINSSQILFSKSNAKVLFEESGPVNVWADEFMIEEVFTNYLTNALNHVKDGGLIRIWFEKIGDTVRTYVFNEGKQIPDEELEKLWIKFYKVDKARTREYGGNGIGLSIVAAAMRAHNKDFGVQNMENGVAFYFDLEGEKKENTKNT